MPRLLIAASGTGGHLFPAIALAEALPSNWEIIWLGVPNRLEVDLVPKKYELVTISARGSQSRGFRRLFELFALVAATISVVRLIRRKRIQMIFTTGGYISVPAVLAARLTGIRAVLHESNAFPGKATRLIGSLCDQVALGWPLDSKALPGCKLVVTGTPVRGSFFVKRDMPFWVPHAVGLLILVIGGSQGAVGLNLMVKEVLPFLLEKGFRVVHITGNNYHSDFIHPNYVVKTFTDEIPALLQHADLVISRAGAGAISEFAVTGTPAVLVPYPYAADNHQEFNAIYAAQFGGAVIVHQHDPGKKGLKKVLEPLLIKDIHSSGKPSYLLSQMRTGMQAMAVKDAHNCVASLLDQLLNQETFAKRPKS